MWSEVGGNDGRQLMLVAVGNEIDDGTEHICVRIPMISRGSVPRSSIARMSLSMSDRQSFRCALQMLAMSLAL